MIAINKLNLEFNKKIFQNTTININEGEKLLLYMKSGTGKTSLFKLITGLISPDRGEIYIDNLQLNRKNLESIRKKVFYLDQDVSLPELSISELFNQTYSYKANRNLNADLKEFINYLGELQLDETYMDKMVGELSGGERQRVGLALGFTLKRKVWLLDEPTSALDKELKEKVVDMISNLEKTILVISHDECWHSLKKLDWRV